MWFSAILAALLVVALPALAEPRCHSELAAVQKSVAETPMPQAKEAQVRALLEQVARACRENNEVVAMAGIDQVRAILEEQRKSG